MIILNNDSIYLEIVDLEISGAEFDSRILFVLHVVCIVQAMGLGG